MPVNPKPRQTLFGQHLTKLRNNAALSSTEVAELVGTSANTVCSWESQGHIPNAEEIKALAKVYGCTLDELLMNSPLDRRTIRPTPRMNQLVETISELRHDEKRLWFHLAEDLARSIRSATKTDARQSKSRRTSPKGSPGTGQFPSSKTGT